MAWGLLQEEEGEEEEEKHFPVSPSLPSNEGWLEEEEEDEKEEEEVCR